MRTIRKNVFETNSSSTHVLAISRNSNGIKRPTGVVEFEFGEFGWSYEIYKNTSEKASYIITLISCLDNQEYYLDKLKEILERNDIEYKLPDMNDTEWWYVDHAIEATEWLKKILDNDNKFMNFLFNDESYITTGNDNDCGYLYPGIGVIDNYDDENEFYKKVEAEEERLDIYYKGN